jgi:taurine dioxygenase
MKLQIRRLSYALAAEVVDVQVATPLSERTYEPLHQALLEHCVLLFRGHPFTRDQHIAFSRWFGELDRNEGRRSRIEGYPELSTLINTPKPDGVPLDEHIGGADWHSDASFKVSPCSISLLHGVAIPDVGGDTLFANMYLAYETLSDGMKKLLEPLEGVHMQEEAVLDHSSPERLEASRRENTVVHPIVKVHPETGRKSLYIGDKVMQIAGMTIEESRPLIRFLLEHSRRPQFLYCHRWEKDDLVVWDNRCVNHMALANFDRRHQLRHVEKTSVLGTPCGRIYDRATGVRNIGAGVAA